MRITDVIAEQRFRIKRRLNPKIWTAQSLRPEVRDRLMDIAQEFERFVGVDLDVTDRTITGSNANYNWTAHSDLDLHLIVPGTPTEQQRELYSAKKSLWSQQRQIKIRGLPVECYVQGSDEPHHSTGVYSLDRDQWITEPQRQRPTVDDQAVTAKREDLIRDIDSALTAGSLKDLTRIKDHIVSMRKAGLERGGEYSVENIVFKSLRNLGIIEELTEKIRELEDQALSLENQTLR